MFDPDDFPRDPYGAVTSQAGHAAISGSAVPNLGTGRGYFI